MNFRREEIAAGKYRGSLFSNQELAIVYAFGFERLLVVNQEGVEAEGMLRYIGVNTEKFDNVSDCCAVVKRAVDRARWTTSYSRRLHSGELRFSGAGPSALRHSCGPIRNERPDIAAIEATGRLSAFGKTGQPPAPPPIRSPLKATGRPGFSHTNSLTILRDALKPQQTHGEQLPRNPDPTPRPSR